MITKLSSSSIFIFIYSLSTLGNIILEIILSRNIMLLFERLISYDKTPGYLVYQMMYTKVLIILEISYLANFYFSKNIAAIIQIRTIKLISVTIWLVIAIDLGISPEFICFFALSGFTFMFVGYASKYEHNVIYKNYNHIISTDPDAIKMYIIFQIITATQNATIIFCVLRIFSRTLKISGDNYAVYSAVKLATAFLFEIYKKRESSTYKRVLFLTYTTGMLTIYGVFYIITSVIMRGLYFERLISFLLEIISIINLLLLMLYLYLAKIKKRN